MSFILRSTTPLVVGNFYSNENKSFSYEILAPTAGPAFDIDYSTIFQVGSSCELSCQTEDVTIGYAHVRQKPALKPLNRKPIPATVSVNRLRAISRSGRR